MDVDDALREGGSTLRTLISLSTFSRHLSHFVFLRFSEAESRRTLSHVLGVWRYTTRDLG